MDQTVAEEYKSSLNDLNFNSKPLINMLTMLAEENKKHAALITSTIVNHINSAPPESKLPGLYLVDSIMKNVGEHYLKIFCHHITSLFTSVFEKVDETTRSLMFKLRQTWKDILPNKILYNLDISVKKLDNAWPVTAKNAPKKNLVHQNVSSGTAEQKSNAGSQCIPKKEEKPKLNTDVLLRKLLADQEQLRQIEMKKVQQTMKKKPLVGSHCVREKPLKLNQIQDPKMVKIKMTPVILPYKGNPSAAQKKVAPVIVNIMKPAVEELTVPQKPLSLQPTSSNCIVSVPENSDKSSVGRNSLKISDHQLSQKKCSEKSKHKSQSLENDSLKNTTSTQDASINKYSRSQIATSLNNPMDLLQTKMTEKVRDEKNNVSKNKPDVSYKDRCANELKNNLYENLKSFNKADKFQNKSKILTKDLTKVAKYSPKKKTSQKSSPKFSELSSNTHKELLQQKSSELKISKKKEKVKLLTSAHTSSIIEKKVSLTDEEKGIKSLKDEKFKQDASTVPNKTFDKCIQPPNETIDAIQSNSQPVASGLNYLSLTDKDFGNDSTCDKNLKNDPISNKDFGNVSTSGKDLKNDFTGGKDLKNDFTGDKDLKIGSTSDKGLRIGSTVEKDLKIGSIKEKDLSIVSSDDKNLRIDSSIDKDLKIDSTNDSDIRIDSTNNEDLQISSTNDKDIRIGSTTQSILSCIKVSKSEIKDSVTIKDSEKGEPPQKKIKIEDTEHLNSDQRTIRGPDSPVLFGNKDQDLRKLKEIPILSDELKEDPLVSANQKVADEVCMPRKEHADNLSNFHQPAKFGTRYPSRRRYMNFPIHRTHINRKQCLYDANIGSMIKQAEEKYISGKISQNEYSDLRQDLQKMLEISEYQRSKNFISKLQAVHKAIPEDKKRVQDYHHSSSIPSEEIPIQSPSVLRPPVKPFVLDNKSRFIYFIEDRAFVLMDNNEPRELTFADEPRKVFIESLPEPLILGFNGKSAEFDVDGRRHMIRFGVPGREIYINNHPYEANFGGPPIKAMIEDGHVYKIRLIGPPPQVIIGSKPEYELFVKYHGNIDNSLLKKLPETNEIKAEVLDSAHVCSGALQNSDMLNISYAKYHGNIDHSSLKKLPETNEVKSQVLDSAPVRSGALQNSDMLNISYAKYHGNIDHSSLKKLPETNEVKSQVLDSDLVPSGALQDSDMLNITYAKYHGNTDHSSLKKLPETNEIKSQVLDSALVPSGALRNSDMLNITYAKYQENIDHSSLKKLPETNEVKSEVLDSASVCSGALQDTDMLNIAYAKYQGNIDHSSLKKLPETNEIKSEVLDSTPVRSGVLQDTDMLNITYAKYQGNIDHSSLKKLPETNEVKSEVLDSASVCSGALQDIDMRIKPENAQLSDILLSKDSPFYSEDLKDVDWRIPLSSNLDVDKNIPDLFSETKNISTNVEPWSGNIKQEVKNISYTEEDNNELVTSSQEPKTYEWDASTKSKNVLMNLDRREHFISSNHETWHLKEDDIVNWRHGDHRRTNHPHHPVHYRTYPVQCDSTEHLKDHNQEFNCFNRNRQYNPYPRRPMFHNRRIRGRVRGHGYGPWVSNNYSNRPFRSRGHHPLWDEPVAHKKALLPSFRLHAPVSDYYNLPPPVISTRSFPESFDGSINDFKPEPSESQSIEPSNLYGNVNLESLLEKLISAGIINAKPDDEPSSEVTSSDCVDIDTINDGDTPENVPVIELNAESLRVYHIGVSSALHSGSQCATCGMRFKDMQGENYSRHLDWHFRTNRRERDGAKNALSKRWYVEIEDWIQFEEFEDFEERVPSYFELEADNEQSETVDLPAIPSVPATNNDDESCPICQEQFQLFWVEEEEEWHLRNAVRHDDVTYHPACYEDFKKASETGKAAENDSMNIENSSGDLSWDISDIVPIVLNELLEKVCTNEEKFRISNEESLSVCSNTMEEMSSVELKKMSLVIEEEPSVKKEDISLLEEVILEGKPGEEEIIGVISESDIEADNELPKTESKMVIMQSGGITLKVKAESLQCHSPSNTSEKDTKSASDKLLENDEIDFRPPTPDPNFQVMPPIKKGRELSGLCCIM